MSPAKMLRALARGGAVGDGLLGTCRLEWAGAEAYGEEAILALFAAAPLDLDDADTVRAGTGCALICEDAALVADLYDGRIGRLWRIGAGAVPAPEPAVDVAFDPDLRQQGGGVFGDPADHPELTADAFAAAMAAGDALIDRRAARAHRARAFLVRGFSTDAATAALFAVHRLTTRATPAAGFTYAAALIDRDRTRLILDQHPPRIWTPRL